MSMGGVKLAAMKAAFAVPSGVLMLWVLRLVFGALDCSNQYV